MKVISGVYWDKGRRAVNQDSIMLEQVMTDRGRILMMAVSDGIGGLNEGEIASGYITERLTENFYSQMISLAVKGKEKKYLMKSILRCFYSINEELRRYGEGKGIKLGATISLLLIWKRNYLVFHLGDSRIYLCRRKKIRLLTNDHSDGRCGLTKCLGSFPFQSPDILYGRIYGRCGFLLCTDGFYRTIDSVSMQALIPEDIDSDQQIKKRLWMLGEMAEKRGEEDNLSAVYVVV